MAKPCLRGAKLSLLGDAFEGFKHEIVKEKAEFSQPESHKDMSGAEMEEIEEAFEQNYNQHGCQSASGCRGF